MGCADLVESLERRLQGETTGPQQEAVDAHLVDCADCRSYLDVARRVERQLAERAATSPAALTQARDYALSRVTFVQAQNRRLRWFAAGVAVVPLWDRLVGGPWEGPRAWERLLTDFGSAASVLAAIGLAVFALRHHIAPLELARGDEELFRAYRSHLDEQLRRVGRAPWVVGSTLSLTVIGVIVATLFLRLPHFPWLGISCAGLFGGMLGTLVLMPTLRKRRETLLRERAALER